MIFGTKKLSVFIVLIILGAYLSLGFLGISLHYGNMSMDASMTQSAGCPFMLGESSLCATNIFDHISAWQNATIGIPAKILLTILLSLAFIFLALFSARILPNIPFLISHERLRNRFVLKKPSAEILHWLSLFENSPSK